MEIRAGDFKLLVMCSSNMKHCLVLVHSLHGINDVDLLSSAACTLICWELKNHKAALFSCNTG